jgi:predicted dehydrogenase
VTLRRPIGVGLVGCGNIAVGRHIPAYLAMSDLARVVAVADPSPERREMAGTMLGIEPDAVLDDALALVDRPDVDVIDICTPPHVRMPVIRRSIERGLPVVCEKPIATIPREAAELVALSESSGVPIAVVHNYRFLPEVVRARQIIEAGEIGRPEVAMLQFLGVEDRPGAAAYRPDWRHLAGVAGGGVLMDMIHVVYVAELLLGGPIVRVSGHVDAREEGAPVEGLALARFETDAGVALVNVGWGVGPGGFAISGPLGRIEMRNQDGATTPFRPPDTLEVVLAGGTHRVERFEPDPAEPVPAVYVTATIRDLLEAFAAGRRPAVTAADGAHVLEAAMAVYESAATGRTVALPLDPEGPVFREGIAGLRSLDLPSWSPVVRRRLFGVGSAPTASEGA